MDHLTTYNFTQTHIHNLFIAFCYDFLSVLLVNFFTTFIYNFLYLFTFLFICITLPFFLIC
jgi:hypothetical protein